MPKNRRYYTYTFNSMVSTGCGHRHSTPGGARRCLHELLKSKPDKLVDRNWIIVCNDRGRVRPLNKEEKAGLRQADFILAGISDLINKLRLDAINRLEAEILEN